METSAVKFLPGIGHQKERGCASAGQVNKQQALPDWAEERSTAEFAEGEQSGAVAGVEEIQIVSK
jgi:hypothetical protein